MDRLWAESARRLLGLRSPEQLPRYLLVLVRRERRLFARRNRRMVLRDPLVLALTRNSGRDLAEEAEQPSPGPLREWIEAALLACTKLQAQVVAAWLEHGVWTRVATTVGCTKGAAKQGFRRAADRIRKAVESGRVPPPPSIQTAA